MRTRSLLQPRVGTVLALVDPALGGHVESVHDFRVAARSLRAALRLLTRRPNSSLMRKTDATLRRAIRALADVRDRDVGRSLIAGLRPETEAEATLKRRMTGLCDADRQRALTQCLQDWPRRLDRLLVEVLDRSEPPLKTIIRRTRAEAWRQRRRAIDHIGMIGRRFAPEELHELRIRIRRLRYALEVLAEVDLGARPRLALLKPLQSGLGDGQDRIVLSKWLTDTAMRLRPTDPALAAELRQQAAHYRLQAVQGHAAFLKLRSGDVLENLALHVDPLRAAPRSGMAGRQVGEVSGSRVDVKARRSP